MMIMMNDNNHQICRFKLSFIIDRLTFMFDHTTYHLIDELFLAIKHISIDKLMIDLIEIP